MRLNAGALWSQAEVMNGLHGANSQENNLNGSCITHNTGQNLHREYYIRKRKKRKCRTWGQQKTILRVMYLPNSL